MKRFTAAFGFFALLGPVALGFEVGETVVAIRNADVSSEGRVVDQVYPGAALQIGGIKGTLLLVNSGNSGWLDSRHVVALDEAVPMLTEMIRQNPQDARLYTGRGLVWAAKKEYGKAIADHDEAIRLNPSEAGFYGNRAVAWSDKGEYDKAIADYNEVLRLEPRYAIRIYNNRGNAYAAKGDYDKAIADYDEILRRGIKHPLLYANRGNALASSGEYEKAVIDFTEAIRLDATPPNGCTFYAARGSAWRNLGEFEKAIADYNDALKLDAKSAQAHNSLAWLWATCPDERYRNGSKSIEHATKACEMTDWKHPDSLGTLAAGYAETGNFIEAVKWQEKASGLYSPKDKERWAFLLELYRQGKPYREETKQRTPSN